MFSFRTTALDEQLDRTLYEGRVACFCTQNSWDVEKNRYIYDLFKERGNLKRVFTPRDAELTPGTNHIEFSELDLEDVDAIVVDIQDVGARYFNYTKDVLRLMEVLKEMDESPSLYIIDHINPAGRVVEGTIINDISELYVPRVAHRHGLTLGELANLYHTEIGARFPLHIISFMSLASSKSLMPWTIAPSSDVPGFFTCDVYSGGGLWNNTNISPGIGTSRPYEYIGAPFIDVADISELPKADGIMIRPASFTPSCGLYQGEKCFGFQLMRVPGLEYHSLMHSLMIIRYFKSRYKEMKIYENFYAKLSDPVLADFVNGTIDESQMREHIKVEEQKWMRKAKKFLLYDNSPYRIK